MLAALRASQGQDRMKHLPYKTSKNLTPGEKASAVLQVQALMKEQNLPLTTAAILLGFSPSLFSGKQSWTARYLSGGEQALQPRQPGPKQAALGGLSYQIESVGWLVPALQYLFTIEEARASRGALSRAVRHAIKLPAFPKGWTQRDRRRFLKRIGQEEVPACPEDLRNELSKRLEKQGDILPHRIERLVVNSFVPRLARLKYEGEVASVAGALLNDLRRKLARLKAATGRVSVSVTISHD
jgi:hypothetical protein